MDSRPANGTPHQRVKHVEKKIAEAFDSPPSFLPFLALHEFEAWLFSSPNALPRVMTEVQKQSKFEAIRAQVKSPEEINERPEHSPSTRIRKLFPAYKKALHGPTTAARIGLDQIRAECPHFDRWMNKLVAYAAQ